MNILGPFADFLALLTFLFFIKVQIDGAIRDLRLPPELDFFFLFFCAIVAAFVGGLLWNALNHLNDSYNFMGRSAYVGGTQSEPHGIAAVLWPLATNLPLVLTLIVLNWKYGFINVREQVLGYSFFVSPQ